MSRKKNQLKKENVKKKLMVQSNQRMVGLNS